jgi:hexosaminidase
MQKHPSLIPRPASYQGLTGQFKFGKTVRILAGAGATGAAKLLAEWLSPKIKVSLGKASKPAPGSIFMAVQDLKGLGEEGYRLSVKADGIELQAPKPLGLLQGVQTLRQLFPPELEKGPVKKALSIPCVQIEDQPRYPWRGLLIDCCRHFMSFEFLKKHVDLLALYKLNRLHLHLTEDQGWRIEIKKYPKLTQIGSVRPRGSEYERQQGSGFYTQKQLKALVAYAESRGVMVIPEFDMPGHGQAALSAYPEYSCTGGPFEVSTELGIHNAIYCAGNEKTYGFLEDILEELLDIFPAPYIHLGADEVPKTPWRACAKCQAKIKADGLKDENGLQTYFIRRIAAFLKERGRRVICWDEILEGGAPEDVMVQAWRGPDRTLAGLEAGCQTISSPYSHTYYEYEIAFHRAFDFEPWPKGAKESQRPLLIGAEGAMWNEGTPESAVDQAIFPELLALSEGLWSPVEGRDYKEFQARVGRQRKRLNVLDVKMGPAEGEESGDHAEEGHSPGVKPDGTI